MEAAKNSRRQRKAAVTRHLGDLQRHLAENDSTAVEGKLQQLKGTFVEFQRTHDTYHELIIQGGATDAEVEGSDTWYEAVQERYIQGVTAAHEWLKGQEYGGDARGYGEPISTELIDLLSMPKVEIDVFSGDPLEFQSFMTVFDETVHSKGVEDQVKLTRLLQYTVGPAKSAIRGCALIGGTDGYQRAREILKARFGDDHLVSQRIISQLKTGGFVYKGTDLQQLADDLSMAAIALDKLSMTGELDNQSSILEILQRCPQYVKTKWRQRALDVRGETGRYPRFATLVQFIGRLAAEACDPVYGTEVRNRVTAPRSGSNFNTSAAMCNSDANTVSPLAYSSSGSGPCVLCNKGHRLFSCETFKGMAPRDRLNVVRQYRLCFNCLVSGHRAHKCSATPACTVLGCGRRHTRFIHGALESCYGRRGQGRVYGNDGNVNDGHVYEHTMSTGGGGNDHGGFNASVRGESGVYLPILPVVVSGRSQACALLDTGSTNTFVTESLVKRMQMSSREAEYHVNTLSRVKVTTSKVVTITLSPVEGGGPVVLKNVLVVPDIPSRCLSVEADTGKHPHLVDLPLNPMGHNEVEVLIGMDNAQLLKPLEVRNGKGVSEPYAVRTYLGWVVQGPSGRETHEVYAHLVTLERQVENLWRLEAEDDRRGMSVEDEKVIRLWDSEVRYEDGHYSLPIPWRDGRPDFPNNEYMAKCRLAGLTRRLTKEGITSKYTEGIETMLNRGYAEPVPDNKLRLSDGSVWYLPHHVVTSAAKPGKVRVVFDCAASQGGISLNNQCYQGPDLNNKLIDVLLRFRLYKYAIMADVEAMYLQVKIPPKDRNALRFLWDVNGQTRHFRMTSHLFGGVWCASSSTYALRRTVDDAGASRLVEDTVKRGFYVDDMLKSVHDVGDVSDVMHGTKQVLSYGGFNLTKVASTSQVVRSKAQFAGG